MSRRTLFKSRSFMVYLIGVWLSAIGDGVFYLALSWMVVQTTGSGLRGADRRLSVTQNAPPRRASAERFAYRSVVAVTVRVPPG